MDLILLKVCVFWAVIAWVWVELLTQNRQLFDFLPKYYPAFLKRGLTCSYCLAGWLSMVSFPVTVIFLLDGAAISIPQFELYVFFSPFLAMALVQIIRGNGR